MKIYSIIVLFILLSSMACTTRTAKIINEKKGKLVSSSGLQLKETKRFMLDSETAPTPQYMQVYKDSNNLKYFTFLNNYNNTIYFYDYNSLDFVKKLTFERKGPNGVEEILGFYIMSLDSIFLFNKVSTDIILTNRNAEILNKFSLRGGKDAKSWFYFLPQYYPSTVTLFKEINGAIILTGHTFKSLSTDEIHTFKFNARVDLKSKNVDFTHTYPEDLYGSGYNWEGGPFTEVYSDYNHNTDKLIFSFPVSHELYITDFKSEKYDRYYAGSNEAGTINSIDKNIKNTTRENIGKHYGEQDVYEGIVYDPYRNVYYRVMRKSIPNASSISQIKDKEVVIIILDKDYNYLGEKILGTGKEWYPQNMFITEEGLNIEFLNKDEIEEVAITIKVFELKQII